MFKKNFGVFPLNPYIKTFSVKYKDLFSFYS